MYAGLLSQSNFFICRFFLTNNDFGIEGLPPIIFGGKLPFAWRKENFDFSFRIG